MFCIVCSFNHYRNLICIHNLEKGKLLASSKPIWSFWWFLFSLSLCRMVSNQIYVQRLVAFQIRSSCVNVHQIHVNTCKTCQHFNTKGYYLLRVDIRPSTLLEASPVLSWKDTISFIFKITTISNTVLSVIVQSPLSSPNHSLLTSQLWLVFGLSVFRECVSCGTSGFFAACHESRQLSQLPVISWKDTVSFVCHYRSM